MNDRSVLSGLREIVGGMLKSELGIAGCIGITALIQCIPITIVSRTRALSRFINLVH